MNKIQRVIKTCVNEDAPAVVRVAQLLGVTPQFIADQIGIDLGVAEAWFDGRSEIPARETFITAGLLAAEAGRIHALACNDVMNPLNFLFYYIARLAEVWLLEARFEMESRLTLEEVLSAAKEAEDYLQVIVLRNENAGKNVF
jgi:hypothetical protein